MSRETSKEKKTFLAKENRKDGGLEKCKYCTTHYIDKKNAFKGALALKTQQEA